MRAAPIPVSTMPSPAKTNPSRTGSAKRTGKSRAPAARDPTVAAVLESYSGPIRTKLQALRKLILDTARATKGVGALEETLKWGQVSYLTSASKTGSTIRIDRVKSAEDQVAVYFHCQTNLVETFREFHPELNFSGNRAIVLDASRKLPEQELRHCIALALTYHLARRKGVRKL
jgi:Domain of unknown function (DU1801)